MENATVFHDPRCDSHRVPPGFPECPERIELVTAHLHRADVRLEPAVGAAEVTRRAAERIHDPAYLDRLEAARPESLPFLDTPDNPLSPGTVAAAWAAAECAIAAGERTMASDGHGLSLARPPGHHCERDRAMGFCFLNSVAILAQHLIDHHGVERVAIVDFDVHHGNGTQHLFEDRSDVLYASVHQWPFYPGTGAADERGTGGGEGATLNVPLRAGSGDEPVLRALRTELLAAVRAHRPEVLLASAGFDAWRNDPLGGFEVTEEGFRSIGEALAEAADELCSTRLVSVLEGGYDLEALPRLVEVYLGGAGCA